VEISAGIAADLALLAQALDDPRVDLETGLRTLAADVEHAVASFTGMTFTIALDHHEVRVAVGHGTTDPLAGASLLIPLSDVAPGSRGSLLLHAATPGAFVDLAADLAYALGIDPAALVVDAHLDPRSAESAAIGLADQIAINQAIGVLIGRGHTPESASRELDRRAERDPAGLPAAAERIIRSAAPGRP
jgi:hypothetical protein